MGYKVVTADLHRVLGVRQTTKQASMACPPVDHFPSPRSGPASSSPS